jgi:hypothetical protein
MDLDSKKRLHGDMRATVHRSETVIEEYRSTIQQLTTDFISDWKIKQQSLGNSQHVLSSGKALTGKAGGLSVWIDRVKLG